MKVLPGESVPKALGFELDGHFVRTVQVMGWPGLANGRLLAVMAENAFEVFNIRPSRQAIQCDKQEHLIPVPWGRIQMWRERTPACTEGEPDVFVLRFLGARGRAEMGTTDPLNRLPHARGEIWIANPPGFGISTGPVSLRRYAASALRVFDEMAAIAGNRKVWVYGQSFGTAAALHVAANRSIDWQVLRNVTPVQNLMQWHAPYPVKWAARALARTMPDELDVRRNAARSENRCLFLTSRDDRLSPFQVQSQVHKLYGGPAEVCLAAGMHDQHVLTADDDLRYRHHVERAYGGAEK